MKSEKRNNRETSEEESWLGILAGLELFGEFEFALGVLGAAEIAIGLAEKMMRDVVVGIHGNGALKSANGELGFTFFLQDFAKEYVRTGGSSVEPDRALEKFFGLVEFLEARVGVSEFVIGDGIAGVESKFVFELGRGFGNF